MEKQTKEKNEKKLKYNPDKKVTVRSIANWTTGFKRVESVGDVTIPANGSVVLNASEIISQVQNGNRLLIGNDAQGSHATLYIDDKATRIEANFELEDTEQGIVTNDLVKKIFDEKDMKKFEEEIIENFATRAEKYFLIKTIKDLKLNDFSKIKFCERYTGVEVY